MTQCCDRQFKLYLRIGKCCTVAHTMCSPVPFTVLGMSHGLGMNFDDTLWNKLKRMCSALSVLRTFVCVCLSLCLPVCVHTHNTGASHPQCRQQGFLLPLFQLDKNCTTVVSLGSVWGWFHCVFQVLGESVAFVLTAERGWGRIGGLVLTLLLLR